jgi:hypothetical protein
MYDRVSLELLPYKISRANVLDYRLDERVQ